MAISALVSKSLQVSTYKFKSNKNIFLTLEPDLKLAGSTH